MRITVVHNELDANICLTDVVDTEHLISIQYIECIFTQVI